MSMNRISMALDDVVKADKKANKGNKNGKKGGANKAKKGAVVNKPATAKLVQKLVKRALAQRGVGVKPKTVVRNKPAGNRTVVRKIVRKVNTPNNRRPKNLGVSQRSRTIVRRRTLPAPQPTRTIVREVRYIREAPRPSPRVERRVVYHPRPQPRIVYVDSPRRQDRRSFGSVYSNNRRSPNVRRSADPFYEPRNFLQRVTGRY